MLGGCATHFTSYSYLNFAEVDDMYVHYSIVNCTTVVAKAATHKTYRTCTAWGRANTNVLMREQASGAVSRILLVECVQYAISSLILLLIIDDQAPRETFWDDWFDLSR